jgi:hypothetical protein
MDSDDFVVDYKNGSYVITNGSIIDPLPEKFKDNGMICVGRTIKSDLLSDILINPCVGTLHLSSRRLYSVATKGFVRKEFTPFLHFMPKVLVKTKKTELQSDMYVSITIDGYENGNFLGTVLDYLGNVGDSKTDFNLIETAALGHWTKKIDRQTYEIIDLTPERLTIEHDDCYSIDPPGCNDIDDAICVRKVDDTFEIYIHIADVTSYIPDNSFLDSELSKRCETWYSQIPGSSPQHMIPPTLSIDHMSLKKGNLKRAFSVIVRTDAMGVILDIQFKKTMVNIKDNLSYEQAQTMISKELNNMYNLAFILKTKHFNSSFDPTEIYDTHQMIAIYMLLANKLVAEQIVSYDPINALIRTHHQEIKHVESDDGLMKMHYLSTIEKASYQRGTINAEHMGLNLKHYTHFTSPMRRYADICVHRQLWKSLNNEPISYLPSGTYFRLNMYGKIYQTVERYSKMLNIVHALTDSTLEQIGYIINLRYDDLPVARVYLPKWDITHDIILCPKKLLPAICIKKTDDGIELLTDTTNITLNLFQEVKLFISITKNTMNKLNVIITNPNMCTIFDETYCDFT